MLAPRLMLVSQWAHGSKKAVIFSFLALTTLSPHAAFAGSNNGTKPKGETLFAEPQSVESLGVLPSGQQETSSASAYEANQREIREIEERAQAAKEMADAFARVMKIQEQFRNLQSLPEGYRKILIATDPIFGQLQSDPILEIDLRRVQWDRDRLLAELNRLDPLELEALIIEDRGATYRKLETIFRLNRERLGAQSHGDLSREEVRRLEEFELATLSEFTRFSRESADVIDVYQKDSLALLEIIPNGPSVIQPLARLFAFDAIQRIRSAERELSPKVKEMSDVPIWAGPLASVAVMAATLLLMEFDVVHIRSGSEIATGTAISMAPTIVGYGKLVFDRLMGEKRARKRAAKIAKKELAILDERRGSLLETACAVLLTPRRLP